jgi:hypothetical protein
MQHESRGILGGKRVPWADATRARRALWEKIRIGWYVLLLAACVPASIARFIAFELRRISALGRCLLADLRRPAVIAVLGVE